MPDSLDDELQPYLEVRREGRPLASFVAQLDEGARGALRRLSLVMLRPDALLGGTALPILDWLAAEHGVQVLALRVCALEPRGFDGQYVTELPLIAPGLRLHHRVAAAGPTAFAIVVGDPPGGESLALALDRWKGASSPGAEDSTDTIRSRFGRQSSFHVVAHTSEDAGDFLQGAIGVFGWRAVRPLLDLVAAATVPAVEPAYRDLLLGELAAPPDRNVYEVLLSVKRRILATLALLGVEPEATLAGLYEQCSFTDLALFADKRARYIELARAERPLLAALLDRLERTPLEPDGDGSVAERWRAVEHATAGRRLAYASWFLSGHEEYDRDDGTALFALLAEHSIVLSPWEQTLVSAALLSDVNPNAVFAGHRTYPLDP